MPHYSYNGSTSWMTGDFATMYKQRYDMIPLLHSRRTRGRPYVVFATDETVPTKYKFNHAPIHIVGLVTEEFKLGVYADWFRLTTRIDRNSIQREFYDYRTEGGRAEVDSTPNSPKADAMLHKLLNSIVPNELQAPLPGSYGQASAIAKAKLLAYFGLVDNLGVHDTGLIVGL